MATQQDAPEENWAESRALESCLVPQGCEEAGEDHYYNLVPKTELKKIFEINTPVQLEIPAHIKPDPTNEDFTAWKADLAVELPHSE